MYGVPSSRAGGTLLHGWSDTSGSQVCSACALIFHCLLSCMFPFWGKGELKDSIFSVNQVDWCLSWELNCTQSHSAYFLDIQIIENCRDARLCASPWIFKALLWGLYFLIHLCSAGHKRMLLMVRVHKLVLEGVLYHYWMQFYVFSCVYTAPLTNYTPLLGFKKSLCKTSQGRHRGGEQQWRPWEIRRSKIIREERTFGIHFLLFFSHSTELSCLSL